MEQQQPTRHDLKAQALLERISELESEKADLRVELTIYANEIQKLQAHIEELEAPRVPQDDAPAADEEN